MFISIITPTFNVANTIQENLISIQNQSFKNIEHLIIDNQSTDKTLDIIRSLAPETVIVSEKDHGIYDAMNKGIKMAKGDIIGILNADDFYAFNDVLTEVFNIFTKYPEVQLVYGDLQYVRQKDTTKISRTWIAGLFTDATWKKGWMPPHPTIFVRSSIYKKYGLFDTKLRSSADYEFLLRVLYKHKIRAMYLPKVMVNMRSGGQSNKSIKNRLLANKEDTLAWKINGLHPHPWFRLLKPLQKLHQFIRKEIKSGNL